MYHGIYCVCCFIWFGWERLVVVVCGANVLPGDLKREREMLPTTNETYCHNKLDALVWLGCLMPPADGQVDQQTTHCNSFLTIFKADEKEDEYASFSYVWWCCVCTYRIWFCFRFEMPKRSGCVCIFNIRGGDRSMEYIILNFAKPHSRRMIIREGEIDGNDLTKRRAIEWVMLHSFGEQEYHFRFSPTYCWPRASKIWASCETTHFAFVKSKMIRYKVWKMSVFFFE